MPLGSGLITRRGRWRPGGWQNRRRGRSRRSGLQGAASSSVGKKDSRFCDACDPASCCNALVSCGSDGVGCPAGPASYGFCPCHTFNPPLPWPQAAGPLRTTSAPVKSLHCPSAGGVAGDHLCCYRPHGACWSCPPWCHQSGGGHPLVEAGRRGMGFDVSGVNHQHLWLWGIRRLCGIGC